MTNDDFKKLLDETIKPVNEKLNELGKGLEEVKKDISGVKKDIKSLKEEQHDQRKLIEDRILPPLVYVETTVKSYADRYVANEDHIGRLDERLHTVEANLGIQPPQELTIPSI